MMSFFKAKQLYRVEIIKSCPVHPVTSSRLYSPTPESLRIGRKGYIPTGTKGWIIKLWGRKYFSADENQPGLDLFTPVDTTGIYIPLGKIKDNYQIISA